MKQLRERRWIILSADGRYVTLGRASDPSEDELHEAEEALRSRGIAGWLAIMEGNPYTGAIPSLMKVKALAEPSSPFEAAAAACIEAIVLART